MLLLMHKDTIEKTCDTLSANQKIDLLSFLEERQLNLSRKYLKEILATCKISKQDVLEIAKVSNALSFTDHYWLKTSNDQTWSNMNLFDNEFNKQVEITSITGNVFNITDKIYTGELCLKGTRAKCIQRNNGELYLIKELSQREALNEVLASEILECLNIKHAIYKYYVNDGTHYSISPLFTNSGTELIHYRQLMNNNNENEMSINTKSYKYLEANYLYDLFTMLLFDFLTLNIDRNRDNFGLIDKDGKELFAPLYDHDSCFKGKSLKAHYFVTGTTFEEVLNLLKVYNSIIHYNKKHLNNLTTFVNSEKVRILLSTDYDAFCQRIQLLRTTFNENV